MQTNNTNKAAWEIRLDLERAFHFSMAGTREEFDAAKKALQDFIREEDAKAGIQYDHAADYDLLDYAACHEAACNR